VAGLFTAIADKTMTRLRYYCRARTASNRLSAKLPRCHVWASSHSMGTLFALTILGHGIAGPAGILGS
jgi:hypothetical protein